MSVLLLSDCGGGGDGMLVLSVWSAVVAVVVSRCCQSAVPCCGGSVMQL